MGSVGPAAAVAMHTGNHSGDPIVSYVGNRPDPV